MVISTAEPVRVKENEQFPFIVPLISARNLPSMADKSACVYRVMVIVHRVPCTTDPVGGLVGEGCGTLDSIMIVLTFPTNITMATSLCEVAIYRRSPCQADT
jgi:hypothetical protein